MAKRSAEYDGAAPTGGGAVPIEQLRDRVERLEARAERADARAAEWRERCLAAEGEVDELLRSLAGAAEDLRGLRALSPRRFLASRRVERAIDRHWRRSLPKRN